MTSQPLRLCLVDMNNGVPNQAIRCFRRILDAFSARVREANPGLEVALGHVQPRNLGEGPDRAADLVLSSGGPGSPFEDFDLPWGTGFKQFLDSVVERNLQDPGRAPRVLAVCHSFELSMIHFGIARVARRPAGRKFGIMPCYTTAEGLKSVAFKPFGDRLFAFENRHWEAVDPDETRMKLLGSRVLSRESRPGRSDKGTALLAVEFAAGITGTQFHPEADRAGVLSWVYNPETASEFKKVYGEALYARMVKTVDDPNRVARTWAMFIPSWLTDAFNSLAGARGWQPLGPPIQNLDEFAPKGSAAV